VIDIENVVYYPLHLTGTYRNSMLLCSKKIISYELQPLEHSNYNTQMAWLLLAVMVVVDDLVDLAIVDSKITWPLP
jgi:hypothetical protein